MPSEVAHISLKKRRQVLRYFSPSKSASSLGRMVCPASRMARYPSMLASSTRFRYAVSPRSFFQVAVCLIAGEGRRHHKRGMAEQIVLHVRLVNNLIFCAVEDAPDQLFIGDCTIYQNFHSLPPNPIFTICIFIPLSPTLVRNRKKPLTEGSFRSL